MYLAVWNYGSLTCLLLFIDDSVYSLRDVIACCNRCLAVVFNSKATCSDWMTKNADSLTLGEKKLRALAYADKERKAMELRRKLNAEKRKQQKENKTEEPGARSCALQ